MLDRPATFRLNPSEREQLARDGYVLRPAVFDAAECGAIVRDCEAMVAGLLSGRRASKRIVGSYMFEMARAAGTIVKWEPDAPDVVQGVEPFAHFNQPLNAWGLDPRLVDPCKDIVGEDDLNLFTEKLNVKRALRGGPIVLHQDYPYWETT